jgi:predicted tellurium resistance membrane protein TerC
MSAELFTWASLVSLLTLTVLEIVLGIDNIIFISIVSGKLPKDQQRKARLTGLALALIMRIALLFGITWIIQLKDPVFTVFEHDVSWRDMILLAGGLFLLAKSTTEIHGKLEGEEESDSKKASITMASAIIQIVLLDMVFSFDSILTAIGIADEVLIMITAVIISLGIMLVFAHKVSDFVNKHPTIKMLALSFLLMIGFLLMAEGFHIEVPKGYLYFAMAFSLIVELLNMRMRKKSKPIQLKYSKLKYDEVDEKKHTPHPLIVKKKK